jgi:hypothetical protein
MAATACWHVEHGRPGAVAEEAEGHATEMADGTAGGLDLYGCAERRGERPRTDAR